MADMSANKHAVAARANERAPTAAEHSQDTSITGPLLFIASFAIGALFVAETVFGLLWALGGEFRTYVSFLQ
jgi:hypothetical protein